MPDAEKLRKIPLDAFRRQLLAVFPVFLDTFMIGCTSGWTSNAIYFFHNGDPYPFTPAQCSVIASWSEIGRMVCAIPSGYLADRLGRKQIMTISGILHLVAWTLLSFFSTYTSIITARFILGTGSALVCSVSILTMGEISSPEVRAKITSISQVFFTLGQIFPSILNILFSSYHIIAYSATGIATIYFVFLYWLIETPQFLVSRSKFDEAKANLKIIRTGYSEREIDDEFENFKKYIEDEKKRKQELHWLKFISSREILKPLLLAIIIHYLVQGMGAMVMIAYITKIIPKVQFLATRCYPFMWQFMTIISSTLAPFVVELFPRRVIFMGLSLFAFFNLLLLGTTYFCVVDSINVYQWVILVCILLVQSIIGNLNNTITCTIRGELLPQAIKGIGGSVCVMAQSVSNIVNFQVYRFFAQSNQLYWMFFIYAFDALVLFFVIYLFLLETRGRFLADIQVREGKRKGDEKEHVESTKGV